MDSPPLIYTPLPLISLPLSFTPPVITPSYYKLYLIAEEETKYIILGGMERGEGRSEGMNKRISFRLAL
jgi:hypothetical protein